MAREDYESQRAETEREREVEVANLLADVAREDYESQRDEIETAYRQARDGDPDGRIEGLRNLTDLSPTLAERELDRVLRSGESSEDVRLEAYDLLKGASDGDRSVDVMVRALRDRSARVREEAATDLRFEDAEANPTVIAGLRSALALERDEDVRESIEGTLEDKDPEFAEWKATELSVSDDSDASSVMLDALEQRQGVGVAPSAPPTIPAARSKR